MFTNIFMYFGPMWSAALLMAVVVLPFSFALVETLRLARPTSRRPCLPMTRLYRLRQRVAHSLATAHGGGVELRRRLLKASAGVGRAPRG